MQINLIQQKETRDVQFSYYHYTALFAEIATVPYFFFLYIKFITYYVIIGNKEE